MNMKASETFGEYYVRLPLRKSANIRHGNALRVDWQSLLNKESNFTVHTDLANIVLQDEGVEYKAVNVFAKEVKFINSDQIKPSPFIKFDYIFGNPPFVGSKFMSIEQRKDIENLFKSVKGAGILDYVSGWYIKAAQYIHDQSSRNLTKAAFVSTNSISQGEQVGILWKELLNKFNTKIHFAHRTFSWSNEARGNAAVHVVIVGFSNIDLSEKHLFEYEDIKAEPLQIKVKNINHYLVDAKDVILQKRSVPICKVPEIKFGNQPIDGGNLLLSEEEKISFIEKEPLLKKYIRQYYGSEEFIKNIRRYCLWLKDASPDEVRNSKLIMERLSKVRRFREASVRKETRALANLPSQFAFVSHTETEYIIIPSVSSERRKYIPIGFMDKDTIASNLCLIIPKATPYHFGILVSDMHMAWVKNVCGRLKSDYRYSNTIVYNNFPWPESPTDKQKEAVEAAAQAVLDARALFPDASLADLYDPNTMPPALVKAHQALDKAVDLCYRPQPFINETKRIEFLFELYDKYTSGLFGKEKRKKG
jgi:hypothetical protein